MRIQKIRYESFGGIIGTEDPVNLLWVDRDFLRCRGFDGGAAWEGPGGEPTVSHPVEMEITVTLRCNLNCPCCYTGAGSDGTDVPLADVTAALRAAAEMNVFHVAFGGGEPLLHPDLLDMAAQARRLNLVPALTTNGLLVTGEWAERARSLFARVNVSADVGGAARDGSVDLQTALEAVALLGDAGVTSGVNYIVTREGFADIARVFREAAAAGADSVLILRPKPDGRGGRIYRRLHPTVQQQQELLPVVLELSERYGIPFHLDCAWAPLMLTAGIAGENLHLLGARGCIAGELLVTVDEAGLIHPCSHLPHAGGAVRDLPGRWNHAEQVFPGFSDRRTISPAGACGSCGVLSLCGGGCPAVTVRHGGSADDPDPDIACRPAAAAR